MNWREQIRDVRRKALDNLVQAMAQSVREPNPVTTADPGTLGRFYYLALETNRMRYAVEQLKLAGYEPQNSGPGRLTITHNSGPVHFFPYTGWATGRGITDGRGLRKLLRQLNKEITQGTHSPGTT